MFTIELVCFSPQGLCACKVQYFPI
uniref:Uncharacterized protein n=1 Tax=Rhizophora mucronata TaxID=61149 RepID=A0A2P2P6H8_RHIMU